MASVTRIAKFGKELLKNPPKRYTPPSAWPTVIEGKATGPTLWGQVCMLAAMRRRQKASFGATKFAWKEEGGKHPKGGVEVGSKFFKNLSGMKSMDKSNLHKFVLLFVSLFDLYDLV